MIFALSSLAVGWTGSARRLQGRYRSVASIAGSIRSPSPSSRPSSAFAVREGDARAVGGPTAAWSVILVMAAGGTRTIRSGAQAGVVLCGDCQLPLTCPLPSRGIRRAWCLPVRTSTMIQPRMGRGTSRRCPSGAISCTTVSSTTGGAGRRCAGAGDRRSLLGPLSLERFRFRRNHMREHAFRRGSSTGSMKGEKALMAARRFPPGARR